ncbi:protein Wiz isoform X3 [Pleurodeles waltl]|uniref:protein Wiz isoform X3 n=1 Tax=Pleurodeles waltl TaxID=8319 RepID=UPI003709AA0A
MERLSPPPYPGKQFSEHGATHMLVTLDQGDNHPRLNDCSPIGEDKTFYDQNANMSMGDVDLSGVSSEVDMDRQALFFHPFEQERMIKEGGGAPHGAFMGRFPDGSGMFTSLPRPELRLDFEDHVRDEHIPNIRRGIGATAHRSQFCHDGGEQVGLFKPTSMLASSFQDPTDFRNLKVSDDISWERSLQEIREKGSREERTSKAVSDSRDFLNLNKQRESLLSLESRLARVMKRSSEHVENNQLDLHSHVSIERYPPSTQSHFESMDDLNNSGAFTHEHLEKSKSSFQRFEWITDRGVSPNSISREEAPGIPLRGQTVRGDPPPITLPIFRKSLNTSVGKPSYYEDVSIHTKAVSLESEMTQLSGLNSAADWALQKQNHQVGMDVSGCKQTWTVNDDDSLEQIPPEPLVPVACSNYDADMAPYMCSMLLDDHGKEDPEDDDEASVYTCIECSIYFKKKEHLMEHMLQHTREPGPNLQEPPLSMLGQFSCNECGWSFGESTALEQHRRLHQESREKIIEEIQKLNDFSDEGREARLQCPKCVFGTNSSKVFVQHAKMHVKERKDQEVKGVLDTTVDEAQETRDLTIQRFKPNEPHLPATPTEDPTPMLMKGASTCIICGFPAPSESILNHHVKYSHSSSSWDSKTCGEDTNEPGTSKESYALPKPRSYPETEIIIKKEPSPPSLLQPPLLPPQLPHLPSPPPPLPSQSHKDVQVKREPGLDFAPGHERPDSSNISTRKGIPLSKFQNRKLLPYGSLPRKYGNSYPSSKSYAPQAALKIKKKILAPFKGHAIDNRRKHGALLGLRHGWSSGKQYDGLGGGFFKLKTGLQPTAKRVNKPMIPRSALELKRTFRNTLRSSDSNTVSDEQRHQLRLMVPVVVINSISDKRKKMKPGRKPFKKKGFSLGTSSAGRPSLRKRVLDGSYPLDLLLEGSLEADELLDPDNLILRSEEKKCPYCPDQFHNGIGLANHVRGHLNRVGVSYNVRHFISAEEVKAIEQKFSFQKKKKKGEPTLRYEAPWPLVGRPSTLKGSSHVANFDPSTFSLMRCEFCGAGFDTRAGLSSHARAHLRDFGITNWELTISPINILKELLANSPDRRALQAVGSSEPSSPNHLREAPSYRPKSITPMSEGSIARSPHSPLTTSWAVESSQPSKDSRRFLLQLCGSLSTSAPHEPAPFGASFDLPTARFARGDETDAIFLLLLAAVSSEEEEMVAMNLDSPPSQNKIPPLVQQPSLEQNLSRMGSRMSPDPLGSKQDLQDSKLQTLTTCEVCGACFETRKGLSSHARSHLRQLGVAESESSGAPIDLLYELAKQTKVKPESTPPSPTHGKKPNSPPKEGMASPHPPLLSLSKPLDVPTNRAIKSPPSFSPKSHQQSGSPLKKGYSQFPASPTPKNVEEKSTKMHQSPLCSSPRSHWGPSDDEGPLNLTVDDDPDSEIDCQLCGAWFETRKGLSSHARAHLRHLGVADPDSKESPVDLLNELILSDDFQSHLLSLRPSERKLLAAVGLSEKPSPKNMGTASAGSMAALSLPGGGMKKLLLPAAGGGVMKHLPPHLRPYGKQQAPYPSHTSPPPKKLKQHIASMPRKHSLSPGSYWPSSPSEMSPINLSSGAEPVRDIRCEFCGEYFENRKGLSSHARSHLRQMGVTEWYMNGSPIDTMKDLLKRRSQPRPSSNSPLQGPNPSPKPMPKSIINSVSMGTNSPVEIRVPTISKKMPMPLGSPMARSPQLSPPTARKMFHSMSPPSMHKKPKPEHMKFHYKREMMPVNLSNEHLAVNRSWESQDEMSPLNLSSRVEPVRDIRCEFCGEYFENRKGLSSHARSHLRQMGVTEWSVNGSPIDTLRELLQKKAKPFLIKKEPSTASPEPSLPRSPPLLLAKPHRDEGVTPNSPGKVLQIMPMSPMGGRPGRPVQQHPGTSTLNRDIPLSLVGGKPHGPFFTPLSMKRPLQEERMIHSGEPKPKAYIQTELHFKSKPKSTQEKSLLQTSSEACCELCGLYFENRKALASHARAHLRQFGVTEWCVNGSPIETLTEWIKHRPQKAGAYRSYIQGGRPFTKKFRKGAHSSDRESLIKKPSMMLQSPGAPVILKGLENDGLHAESSRSVDNGSSSNIIDSPSLGSASLHMQREEFLSQNINKFERRPARPPEVQNPKDTEACEFQPKVDEVRQTPQKVRPVPSLVPRPPQTSLVKFVGNIYTLKCRFCEVEFQGPLSIQEEWVRHLQRHILEMNFSKAVPLRDEVEIPMTTEVQ